MIHYRSVPREILREMMATRAVDMASMHGYLYLLVSCFHTAKTHVIDGKVMKEVRLKGDKCIFEQRKMA